MKPDLRIKPPPYRNEGRLPQARALLKLRAALVYLLWAMLLLALAYSIYLEQSYQMDLYKRKYPNTDALDYFLDQNNQK